MKRFAIQAVGTYRTIETFDSRYQAVRFAKSSKSRCMVFDYTCKMIIHRNWLDS